MDISPKIIDLVVKKDICIGCGLCTYKCPNKAIEVKWNDYGFLTPILVKPCLDNGACITVCPFNPMPEKEVKTEDELSNRFLYDASNYHNNIGNYQNIFVGFSKEFRLSSSSGGVATYIFSELLERDIVKYIFSVSDSIASGSHFEYNIFTTKEGIITASKTKYYPVTLANVFSKIDELDGKVAIVGVACFIKAIRLAQYTDPILKEKIPFLVGIICGGVKSSFFTEYLSGKVGVIKNDISKPEYRIKNIVSSAGDYSYGCTFNSHIRSIKMRSLGDMWGTGLFKANACDYCDDVTTELADVSLGDAWLSPYDKDGKGSNVIVTRSKLADSIIVEGILSAKLNAKLLSVEDFLLSQKGNFNHRQVALHYRFNKNKELRDYISTKRFANSGKLSIDSKIVQFFRMKVRKLSLEKWFVSTNSVTFDNLMKKDLFYLKVATKLNHYMRAIRIRLNLK